MESEINFKDFKECVILVEGKRDVAALKSLGFKKVFAVHKIGVSVHETVEQIVSNVGLKQDFCVLMDFDLVGRKLHIQVMNILQELGARVDTRFRRVLRKEGVSHIEGLRRITYRKI